MPRKVGGPLTETDLKKINEQLQALENTSTEVQRALSAGMDCAAEDALCQDLKARLNQIKAVYFPEHP
jgi:hypothetical protein